MSDFKDSVDWNYAVARLRTSCIGQPLELQAVWMFEILAVLLFLKHKDKAKDVKRIEGAYRLTHAKMINFAASVGLTESTVGILSAYRDKFVHFGYLEATPLLERFFSETSSQDLDRLQQYTGVTLNMRNSLA